MSANNLRLRQRPRLLPLLLLLAVLAGLTLSHPTAARAATPALNCDREPSGYGHRIHLFFRTGEDDLRGNNWWGDDNLDVTLISRLHQPLLVPNVNKGENWPAHSTREVIICVTNEQIQADEVTGLRLATTNAFGGVYDNWDLDWLTYQFEDFVLGRWVPAGKLLVSGTPLHRFDGDAPGFDFRVDPVLDGGFEAQGSSAVNTPWFTEGTDWKGVDRNLHNAQSGQNNGFTWSTGRNWNAVLQNVPVTPGTSYVLTGWVRTSKNVNTGFFGARLSGEWPPRGEAHFGFTGSDYQQLTVRFNSTNHTQATVYVGLWGVNTPGGDWIQVDNISLRAER
ncbi:hypothetical protein [Frankia sp. AgB32]|uniref:hypothetical protein n=1 Tax=Frankia sp. AgB32 TaxID=631119 RepID=UPI00200DEFF6|nr:hypothetical protein [Frankia sp. AgB32]MCK9893415.1 hypothetical protein [Frankia sp. AgB32]